MIRRCNKCKIEKPLDQFTKNNGRPFGRGYICLSCDAERVRQYRKNSPKWNGDRELINQQKAEYMREHKEKYRVYYRDYNRNRRDTNKVKIRALVQAAIERGDLPKVNTRMCQYPGCNEQANEYHHENYEIERALDVIPLCYKHHGMVHRNKGIVVPRTNEG